MKSVIVLFPLVLLASACGKIAELEPASGETLPQKPALATSVPSAEQLLDLPPQAKPQRVDELRKRGEPRKPDPFDLPPATGSRAGPQTDANDPATKEPNRA